MKKVNFKRLAIIAIAVMMSVATNAQEDSFWKRLNAPSAHSGGVRAGVNLANVKMSGNGETFKADMKPGIQIGVENYFMVESFGFQFSALFNQQGFTQDNGIKTTLNLNYLQLPVYAVYKIDVKDAKILLRAGPYVSTLISGKLKYGSESEKFNLFTEDSPFHGFDLGAGVGISARFGSFQANLDYNFGAANIIVAESGSSKMKNTGVAITLSYIFPKK